ncbi:MAG TPA: zinc finger domain-containing protein, partial [Pyrinomonadaceae bacterium]
WLVLHLMIAGRLHWKDRLPEKIPPAKPKFSKTRLADFEFNNGTLSLTEAGTQRRASLHLFASEADLRQLDPGGLEIFGDAGGYSQTADAGAASLDEFSAAVQSANHTLKRALTDPRLLSGIGNAYSDEILFEAQLSPIKLTQKLSGEELERLYHATRSTLIRWVERLRADAGNGFPEKVTAFREGMTVHGRYQLPCPRCGAKIQRIRYATNETNYCPVCQTGGKLLADRALSRILRDDWPKTAEELG